MVTGSGILIATVIESVAEQPVAVLVTVKKYSVVAFGVEVGLSVLALVSVPGGVQLMASPPLLSARIGTLMPRQTVVSFERMSATGSGFTVTVTLAVSSQSVVLFVVTSVYVVLTVGQAVGLEM